MVQIKSNENEEEPRIWSKRVELPIFEGMDTQG